MEIAPVVVAGVAFPIAIGFIAAYWESRAARKPADLERELRATIAAENFRNVQRARLEAERRRGV